MPPKQKITKEELLECAARIAEENGILAVTSRSVAKEAGCSIQPVFSQFPTMDMQAIVGEIMEYAIPRLLGESKEEK